ncbi:MAG: dihydrodipicolinate synthase family protein [Planctomycetales bacterium]
MPDAAPLPAPLRGIIPPMVTPLAGRDELDLPGLERLIEHLLGGGVHGLFILGSNGEGPSHSYRLRNELIGRTCEVVAGRVPVLVGITDTSFVESLHVASVAAEAGAAAVVASTPYYFPLTQAELAGYVERLADESPLPLLLYNMPRLTKVAFDPETVARLMQHPRIAGIKDSSGEIEFLRAFVRIAAERPDFTVVVGPERLLPEGLALGIHGGVCGGANLFPEWFVALYDAATRGDTARVQELRTRIARLQEIYTLTQAGSSMLRGVKCALSLRGICSDRPAEPFEPYGEPERSRVAAILEELASIRGHSPA